MKRQVLPPTVEHSEEADLSSKVFRWLRHAEVLAGGKRHLDLFPEFTGEKIPLESSLDEFIENLKDVSELKRTAVLAFAHWKARLQTAGILGKVEDNTTCCFARQDKLWVTDPDGNAWEVFTVHEQLAVEKPLSQTGCCVPAHPGAARAATCAAA